MLRDEYNRLMQIFHEGAEGKKIDIKELFMQSLALFEDLKEELQKGSPEEKKEVIQMMGDMYKQIMLETRKICQTTGMTEEQLMAYSENPANFTAEQWRMMQESRTRIHKAGRDLLKVVDQINHPKHIEASKIPARKEPGKKSKKSDWKRS